MEQKYVIFVGIILGAVIIGGCIYFGMLNMTRWNVLPQNNYSVLPAQSTLPAQAGQQSSVASKTGQCTADNNTVVTKVIDGDTVVVEGGEHIRLLGIDADEKNYPCYDAAKTGLETLVLGKQVRIERDVTDVDQYDRCLRTIFVGTENIDVQLVKEGLAVARFYPPDIKYKTEISAAEKLAIENKTGCKWAK